MEQSRQRQLLRDIGELLVVGLSTLMFVLTVIGVCLAVFFAPGKRDFISYWASGQLIVHRADPYSTGAILALERSAGYPANTPALIMRNPPLALPLTLPLGFLHPLPAELLWAALLAISLVISVRITAVLCGREKDPLQVLGYSFGPALVCLVTGQMGLFILLGLVLFLRFHRSRPFLAGASLWFCMMKPHLFLPFFAVLAIWALATRSYRILLGVAAALCVSTAVALLLDPHVWMHYRQMLSADNVANTPIPCLSIALRRSISPRTMWLQYLPAAIGCAWAVVFFRRHSHHWDWMEHGSPLMLVSVLVAPYIWITDQSIVIPALLHTAYRTRSRGLLFVLPLASSLIEIGIFRGAQAFHSNFYIWTAPAWLVWYLFAVRKVRPKDGADTLPADATQPAAEGSRLPAYGPAPL